MSTEAGTPAAQEADAADTAPETKPFRYVISKASRGSRSIERSEAEQAIVLKQKAGEERLAKISKEKELAGSGNLRKFMMEHCTGVFLRDACPCPLCVDPSTSQKNFQTSQIPSDIMGEIVTTEPKLKIKWKNDIPGFPTDHISEYNPEAVQMYMNDAGLVEGFNESEPNKVKTWAAADINKNELDFEYEAVLKDDKALLSALRKLKETGFIFLQNIPKEQQNGPLELGNRIGRLRDTFYGLTWDVKSVAQAKNVAYTHQFLGFHMDLLYFADPPGFQMLHCIHNSCAGGASMFSDSFRAAETIQRQDPECFKALSQKPGVVYHYHNNNEHYRHSHAVVEIFENRASGPITAVNYSPPFQAPWTFQSPTPKWLNWHRRCYRVKVMRDALEAFAKETEKEENIFEHKLKEGEMVLFNNRRVLHARRAFEPGQGERWLKGGYIDTDVVKSKLRVLTETVGEGYKGRF